jgi:hypothetical protein
VFQPDLPLYECADPTAAEFVAEPLHSIDESATEPLHSLANSAAALTETSRLYNLII